MIKKGWIKNTVVSVIYYVALIWQKLLKSIFRTLWEIGSLFASFLPGASFSIFLVHFLKPLLLRSLFKNRTEPHGVSLTWLNQISDWTNFPFVKFQISQIWDLWFAKFQTEHIPTTSMNFSKQAKFNLWLPTFNIFSFPKTLSK